MYVGVTLACSSSPEQMNRKNTAEIRSNVERVESKGIEDTLEFEVFKTGKMPSAAIVNGTVHSSGMQSYCDKNFVDQLDKDLLFMKSARIPFEEFKKLKLTGVSEKTAIELFPEDILNTFWTKAREYHRNQNL
jgi:hypothetical protein